MLRYPILSTRSKEFLDRPFIRSQISAAWERIEEDPAYATPNLSTWFRKNRKLGSRDRKIVSEIVFILIRFQASFRRLNLRQLDEKLSFLQQPSWPEHKKPSLEDIACFLSLENSIVQEWGRELSTTEMIDLANHLQSRASIDIRSNPQKISRSKLRTALQQHDITAQPIQNTTLGLRIEHKANLQGTTEYQQGYFEIQDLASQLFCEAISLPPTGTIFDMCAGAGGKSLTMKALHPQATIYAQEPRSNARRELQKRAQRAGVSIRVAKPKRPVDIVLVDAPCSGLGRLRREPALRLGWNQKKLTQLWNIQQEIVENAQSYVKENGQIIYATCSLLASENQHDIEGWHRETTIIWPHRQNCDGFGYSIYTRK